ncbi:MAG: RNA pseudouridine synthase [Clostridiales bacterium]|mgnify:CR=1 FL=1|nr:RNA pseudouridine synthase [Clostridiales bacterium]
MRKFLTVDDLNIVYEDNHLIVVVKPQNVPTCPDESGDPDMLSVIKEYLIKTYNKPGNAYVGLVHRLDRPTGGVMVFAKTSKAASRLSETIRQGELDKRYFAVLMGTPREHQVTHLTHYLKKYPEKNMVYVAAMGEEGAKKAVLNYKILEENATMSLADIKLLTGRSHQIRVQMAALSTPLFGDIKYGGDKTPVGYNIALWEVELKFTHPITKEKLMFRVYPPVDDVPWKFFDVKRFLTITIKNEY